MAVAVSLRNDTTTPLSVTAWAIRPEPKTDDDPGNPAGACVYLRDLDVQITLTTDELLDLAFGALSFKFDDGKTISGYVTDLSGTPPQDEPEAGCCGGACCD